MTKLPDAKQNESYQSVKYNLFRFKAI